MDSRPEWRRLNACLIVDLEEAVRYGRQLVVDRWLMAVNVGRGQRFGRGVAKKFETILLEQVR